MHRGAQLLSSKNMRNCNIKLDAHRPGQDTQLITLRTKKDSYAQDLHISKLIVTSKCARANAKTNILSMHIK